MATLKEHQAAMVDLLANGSGIPASASRLAHAMHDVLDVLANSDLMQFVQKEQIRVREINDATTPGLNDRAISKREKALKTDSPAKWPTPAEQRVKELTNTVGQLRKQSAQYRATISGQKEHIEHLQFELEKLRSEIAMRDLIALSEDLNLYHLPEQAGCRKSDTQACHHEWASLTRADQLECLNCGIIKQ